MEIMVTSVEIDSLSKKIFVRCSSPYGNFCADWQSVEPSMNMKYIVEIEIPGVFKWGDTIKQSNEREFQIRKGSEHVSFNGVLDSIDEDGCASIRFGDSIILLETEGEPISLGKYVSFQSVDVFLFDVKI